MSADSFDVSEIIDEIREVAAAQTAAGMYSAEFEDELRSHFAKLLDRSDGRDRFDSLDAALVDFDRQREFARGRIELTSGVPGGEVLHRTVAKVVSRQVGGLVAQLNSFSGALMPVLTRMSDALADPPAHVHADVLHEIDTMQERLAHVERLAARLDASVRILDNVVPRLQVHLSALDGISARLTAIEERERRRFYDPPFSSVAFADATRGAAADIRSEYSALADALVDVPGPVLDIGAGRGEFLELLRERGLIARGVEIDQELVGLAQADGLDVQLEDGLVALRAEALSSLGAIVLLHVIEHLHPNELLEVIGLARERLAVGGRLVLETPNPQSLYVFARAFWLDPTHTKPVHPTYLEFALRAAGFTDVRYEWTALPSDAERLVEVEGEGETAAAMNENARRLNQLVFAAQNYRVIAVR